VNSTGEIGKERVAEQEEPARPSAAPLGKSRGARIFAAEDFEANQKLLSLLLNWMGHEVTIASDGEEAVALAKAGGFDLFLMDVQMPKLDGLRAAGQIREFEAETGQHILIFAMTAHALAGDREKCIDAGMDEYVGKPIQRKQLERLIA